MKWRARSRDAAHVTFSRSQKLSFARWVRSGKMSKMSLRQQQITVFLATVIFIFGLFATGVWLISRRLTTEATLQTALLMARQVEIALADSLRQRSITIPSQPTAPPPKASSFWSFLGNLLPGTQPAPSPGRPRVTITPPRTAEVKDLMRAFIDRSGSIEAMWVLNAEGVILYSSMGHEKGEALTDPVLSDGLRRGVTTINSHPQGKSNYYDVLVPLQMPAGVQGPGGLRLWVNPADWTGLLSGLWRQLTLLFVLGGAVALMAAFLTTAMYTRRFRLITETLRQAEAGTYASRPIYASQDEVSRSLDLIDRMVMKQRKHTGRPAPVQRLAIAARTLAHEVRTPMNALAIHLELLRNKLQTLDGTDDQSQKAIAALDSSIRQVDHLVRDFTDYSAPIAMQRQPLDAAAVLLASLDDIASPCAHQNITLVKEVIPGPWSIQGDPTRLRQAFDNLLRNAMEAQPNGGEIRVTAIKKDSELIMQFADSGPGVPPEQRESMFEFGHTTKANGSGIGLPLSQLIMESHGGSLTYQDRNGSGSGATFRLTLPLEAN
jgi:signal transduction histidine kinase